ncbi:hypothetical protein Cflav_PD3017 [Pedosphaera parvula Ellin514]|uniref:Uncharacterized protein n=1 Tax=Pedosphaera parvula (strain Ellin514) TaxID=320771 RepID=B9XIQ8_PEDPL|nr:hypothetical protein Cflav_PD3017 [Pedosphaera parvula Ellin514]
MSKQAGQSTSMAYFEEIKKASKPKCPSQRYLNAAANPGEPLGFVIW